MKINTNHTKADSKGTVPAKMPGAAPSNDAATAEKTKVTFDQKDATRGNNKNGDFSQ